MANILYFGSLPDHLKMAAEEIALPADINTVAQFLGWLRERGNNWEQYLAEDNVQVTINRTFAEMVSL